MGLPRLNHFIAGLMTFAICALPAGAQSAVSSPNPVTTPVTGVNGDVAISGYYWQDMGNSAMGQIGVQSSFSPANTGSWIKDAGTLSRLTANVSSITTANVLSSYVLQANSLAAVGDSVFVRIYGTTAANGNTKAVLFKFGTASITLLNAAANAKDFYAEIEIVKTGASTQQINVSGYANAALLTGLSVTASQTDTSNITMSVQLSTATGAADATLTGFAIYGEP